MRPRPTAAGLGLVLGWLSMCGAARGDGGTVRIHERAGQHEVTVFTSPTPVRVGPVDISVLIQEGASGEPVADGSVRVAVSPRGRSGPVFHQVATTETATNKLFHAARFDLPEPGAWDVEVAIPESHGVARLRFTLPVAPALPRWLGLWVWIAWPALAVLVYGLHRFLAGTAARRPDARERSC
jgi:hypothetical protein